MGGGMAERLLERGARVAVYNRSPGRAEPLRRGGAAVVATPAELAASCDVILLSLADERAVGEVLRGSSGVLAGLAPGAVVVDTSTVSPSFARRRASDVADAGGRSLEACVIGNGDHARTGELRFLLGGPEDLARRLAALFELLGKQRTFIGETGSAVTLKLLMNMLMGVQMQALAEAVIVGERAGLRSGTVLQAISMSGFSSPVMRFKCGVMAQGSFEPAGFRLSLMRKDLSLIRAEAQLMSVPLSVAEAAYSVLTAALHKGIGDLDCAAVLLEMRDRAGLVTARPDVAVGPVGSAGTAGRVGTAGTAGTV
jgi:3-hydroxyisobutyrate dehydrogenase